MTDKEILQGLTNIFREVFEDDTIILTPDTTSDDIDRWDSMSQITLAVEIEHQFHVKIRSARMEETRSVAGLMRLIRLLSPATTR
jgi:acyl carrier protein